VSAADVSLDIIFHARPAELLVVRKVDDIVPPRCGKECQSECSRLSPCQIKIECEIPLVEMLANYRRQNRIELPRILGHIGLAIS